MSDCPDSIPQPEAVSAAALVRGEAGFVIVAMTVAQCIKVVYWRADWSEYVYEGEARRLVFLLGGKPLVTVRVADIVEAAFCHADDLAEVVAALRAKYPVEDGGAAGKEVAA